MRLLMQRPSGNRAARTSLVMTASAWVVAGLSLVGGTPARAEKKAAADPAAKSAPTTTPSRSAGLADLLARFAKAPGIFARFREEKHLAILETPLINEGTIHFAPPGRLARHTEKPLASTLLIDGGQLQFGDADGHQSMDLGTNPVARAFVDSFLLLLAGDRRGLEGLFTMSFEPGTAASGWALTLLPRQSPMNKLLARLSLRGRGLVLEEMELRETSGDWSRTVFRDVDVAHVYGAAEAARVFRIPSR